MADLVAMVGFVSGGIYLTKLYKQRRGRAMNAAGMALGFTSISEDDLRLPEMRLLTGKGSLATYSNILRGAAAGYETFIFDFCYVVSGGKTTRGVNQTVAAFHAPGANMPDFQLARRTLEDKLGRLFGAKQLRFEANPNFSDRYIATGADLESAATLFTPGVLSFFEGRTDNLLTVEGYWDWIIVYRPEHRVKPSELGDFVEDATRIASGLLGQVSRPLLTQLI
ncbi:MAG: hypothetical protein ACYDDS_19695 [Candidatus Sulfotelmatobacter sp.]